MKWKQISKRGRLSPFPNHLSMQAVCSVMKDVVGYSYETVLLTFQDGMMYAFFDKDDNKRVKKLALAKAKSEPEVMKRLIKRVERLGADFIQFTKDIFNSDLSSKSDKELKELYKKYCEDYKQIYGTYFVILSMENVVLDFLKDYVDTKHLDEETKSRCVAMLTTCTSAMYPKEEEKELLKISLIENEEERNKKIKEHADKFFWLPHDYEDNIWTEKDFKERIAEIIEKGNAEEKLDEIETFYSDKKNDIEKAEKIINVDEFHSKLFKLIRDGIHLKELRKKIVSTSLYYIYSLLTELGRRHGLTLKQMRYLMEDEVENISKDYREITNSRIKLGACLVENGKTKIYDREEAEKIKKQAIIVPDDIKELKGLPVSPGKAEGRVKIVFDPDQLDKVEPGDIMVTVQAVPSFSSAIKIAGALIADGGTGVTSHPATLAREAGIPGVTGVKIATEVLKDGDLVEVDGDKGIIRRI